MVTVKLINKSDNPVPEFATEGSAGVDLRASLNEKVVLKPLERAMVPTGIFIELPLGTEAQIRPRSGLAAKSGITVLNSPGTIDSDYRGEINVILVNLSNNEFEINNGDRICQMVVHKYEKFKWDRVEELNESVRGHGGFGHTGI
ncbi:MAG: dUTP diphosphatase [Bacteroidales bacterium]|nr:dUTP diphosphatase [Bacteroidales bacterium]